MSKKLLLFLVVLAAGSLLMSMAANTIMGQEGNTFSDGFDEPGLEYYEHSQDVAVSGGVLRIEPGNFIFRQGVWQDPSFSFRFRFTGSSMLLAHYHASERGAYLLHIISGDQNNELLLIKDQQGEGTELALAEEQAFEENGWNDLSVSFSGKQHKITLNGQIAIKADDRESLSPGGIGFIVTGDNGVEIDDLSLKSGTSAVVQGEPEEEVPAEGSQVVEEQFVQEGVDSGRGETDGTDGASAEDTLTADGSGDTGWKSFLEGLFVSGAQPLDFQTFLINLALSALFAYILGLVYIYWGASLSNRRKFAANFIIITVTTTFIILVVRSSVALSLGLVGALSIVRFRAAIKEPEELAYLFLAIGLGIGLGDNQRLITTLAFAFAIAILGLLRLFRRSHADANMHLNITTFPPAKIGLTEVQEALKPYCPKIKLLRFDENDKLLEMSFLVEFSKLDDLGRARKALQGLSEKIDITFLDNKGVW